MVPGLVVGVEVREPGDHRPQGGSHHFPVAGGQGQPQLHGQGAQVGSPQLLEGVDHQAGLEQAIVVLEPVTRILESVDQALVGARNGPQPRQGHELAQGPVAVGTLGLQQAVESGQGIGHVAGTALDLGFDRRPVGSLLLGCGDGDHQHQRAGQDTPRDTHQSTSRGLPSVSVMRTRNHQ